MERARVCRPSKRRSASGIYNTIFSFEPCSTLALAIGRIVGDLPSL
jgi:hypothetical protein